MNTSVETAYILSSRKRRIAAFLIDHFTMTFLIVALAFLSLGVNFIDERNFANLVTKILPTMLIGVFLYIAKDAIKGISIGKWIMGIMIRDENDVSKIPSFGRLLIRNLFLIIWPAELIVLANDQDKRRLGDKYAKTIVVKNPNKSNRLKRVIALAGLLVVFFTFIFVFASLAIKNSNAYKISTEAIEVDNRIINETGGITGYGIMPTGSISTSNGSGKAQLEIKVLGKKKDVNVRAYLAKEPNFDWKLIELKKTN